MLAKYSILFMITLLSIGFFEITLLKWKLHNIYDICHYYSKYGIQSSNLNNYNLYTSSDPAQQLATLPKPAAPLNPPISTISFNNV